jgi:hypothetical protein
MSEFKFACPVCGQHITADSSTSGGQIDCPTCFQKIVVPQAPASADSKFILSASQVGKPRPIGAAIESNDTRPARQTSLPATTALLLLLCVGGATAYVFRAKIFKGAASQSQRSTNASLEQKEAAAPRTVYPIPTNISWTLDSTNVAIPNANAVGKINGDGFFCERAILQGVLAREGVAPAHCDLTLRQGTSKAADLGVTVQLFASAGEALSGKTIQVAPDRPPPVPNVVLRWKNDQQKAVTRNFGSGYALKLSFGEAANSRIPGQIFIGLPDEAKSFVAGTFEAEIRKPAPPKPKTPKPPKPAG